MDAAGKTKKIHISDVKYILPYERTIFKLPDYQSFGRQSNLRINAQHIPNFKWEPAVRVNTNFSAVTHL